jgi:hypothetical protein
VNYPVVQVVLDSGIVRPKAGQDHGDHPPITPLRLASERDLSGDAWSVYDMIARHFIATLSGDMKYLQTTATFDVSGEIFKASGKQVRSCYFDVDPQPIPVNLEHTSTPLRSFFCPPSPRSISRLQCIRHVVY